MSITKIKNTIEEYLNEKKLKYKYMPDRKLIEVPFLISNKLGIISAEIYIRDSDFTIYTRIPIRADKKNLTKVAKYLIELNFGNLLGDFELDCSSGEIRYKVHTDCSNILPSDSIIENALYISLAMMRRNGDEIIRLIYAIDSCNSSGTKTTVHKSSGNDKGNKI